VQALPPDTGARPALVRPALAPLARGNAYQYHQHVMEAVARYRHLSLPHWAQGFVAVRNCAHIGDYVQARIGRLRPAWYRVADCSQTADIPAQAAAGNVIEVAYPIAVLAGFNCYGRGAPGPGAAPAIVYGYRDGPGRDW